MSRYVLTPDALTLVDAVARAGSFAGAARELGKVPSALTYSVRQLEDGLDVLLFDRRSGQAKLTAAGEELLHEGRRLLQQMDAVANRVRRVATGWETQLTIAVEGLMSQPTVLELCAAFYALRPAAAPRRADEPGAAANAARDEADAPTGPVTRLRLRTEVLAGTWEALLSGQADLAIGVAMGLQATTPVGDVQLRTLGDVDFVFAVAPQHPLAACQGPLADAVLLQHRAVAVADSAQRVLPLTVNLLPGQDVLTVASAADKVEAQLRGLGCGYIPEPHARDHIAAGRLVVRQTERPPPTARFGYAWRGGAAGAAALVGDAPARRPPAGLALRWWLDALDRPATRQALLHRRLSALAPGSS